MKLGSTLGLLTAILAGTALAADTTSNSSSSISPIEVSGNAFFNSKTGERFYIRGVDYQPGGPSNLTDPLADSRICGRDIPLFKELGINSIRVYTVDNSLDHDECMQMLADAGIYLILDINTPTASISRVNPGCSYNAHYLQSLFATVDAFAKYDNVLGFFAGNEVLNDEKNTKSATYVKAVVRDVKKYIKARNYRKIPVGYSAADVSSNRVLSAHYFNCGDDEDARIDMFGVNDYSWCGESSFRVSGYSEKMQLYKGYSVPMFLSEFGCIKVESARPFSEISVIYSELMSSLFSGGLAYEYSQEVNKHGLVEIGEGNNITKLQDFENLKNQYSKTSNPTGDGGYSKDSNYSECPVYQEGVWEANNTLPEMPSAASAYFTSGAGTPLGTGLMTQELCEDASIDDDPKPSSISSSQSSTTASSTATTASSKGAAAPGLHAPLAFRILVYLAEFAY
ncbi:1,3-beta-glucanosyltransferase Ecym_8355 [Eremothecium cymbalariae DBVPG|uniref:1,3-beta-glucanosyltransferase n=1 Tax=Eremothecium cymbalariae (strain CBS 270.75 / DBVPG 7215 / KCTC 17166 / NRRL Y-17582) TaxID=931890 RepID=G8JXQ4_ERECY|nr:Hypothetical protein Ecym_8355 [Eremothecium cymbalariae DBVPG\